MTVKNKLSEYIYILIRDQNENRTHLLVEYAISFIDIRDIALVLVEPFPREFVALVLADTCTKRNIEFQAASNDVLIVRYE